MTSFLDCVLLAAKKDPAGDKARELMDQLPQRVPGGGKPEDEEFGWLLAEAKLRINGTPPPWPTGEGAPAEKPAC